MSAALARLAAILKARSGMLIGPDKQYLIDSRLAPLLQREGFRDLASLVAHIEAEPEGPVMRDVVEAMTTGETLFFRDTRPWTHLRTVVLPRLAAGRPAGSRLRLWSAAASAGQEAYSLAMLLADAGIGGDILATDIARARLRYGAEGLFTDFETQRGLPPALKARYFTREAGGWRVAPSLAALVTFREHNLLDDPAALGQFDVVLCRNVLLYLDQALRAQVLAAIVRRLSPGGVLYIGATETMPDGVAVRAMQGVHGAYVHESTTPRAVSNRRSSVPA